MAKSTLPEETAAISSDALWNTAISASRFSLANRPSSWATQQGRISSVASVPTTIFVAAEAVPALLDAPASSDAPLLAAQPTNVIRQQRHKASSIKCFFMRILLFVFALLPLFQPSGSAINGQNAPGCSFWEWGSLCCVLPPLPSPPACPASRPYPFAFRSLPALRLLLPSRLFIPPPHPFSTLLLCPS